MYTQQEASRTRQEFWTAFGQYMAVIPNADGDKINWVNYKTGNRHVHIKMEADNKKATIVIEISHADNHALECYAHLLSSQQHLLETISNLVWDYEPKHANEHGKSVININRELDGANIFDKSNWPALISFFKQSITGFDEFWQMARFSFEL